ncbi:hypothetical protein M8994_21790, partial [Brucella sp. 21LCYQ03]|nr:hypothetical protein [Brucella sp. 21LCYQ03]
MNIKKWAAGKYNISGGQKNSKNGDYLQINGTLQVVNSRELLFQGDILTKITGINGNAECKRSG